jgi:hypothetical protein
MIDFKNLVEEVYYLIIAQMEDEEVEEKKALAVFQSILIECKATDYVCAKYNLDHITLNESIQYYGLDKITFAKRNSQRDS